jgi:hypothetical protein
MLWQREVLELGGTIKLLDILENFISKRLSVDSLYKESNLGISESILALKNLTI